MGNISVSGQLLGGPSSAGGDGVFPAAQFNTPLSLSSASKLFNSATGVLTRNFSDANAFVQLGSIPADVPRANFLYVRAAGAYQLRLTQDDGASGTTVATIQCYGLFMAEFPDTLAVTLVEIAANGKVEYLASGPA